MMFLSLNEFMNYPRYYNLNYKDIDVRWNYIHSCFIFNDYKWILPRDRVLAGKWPYDYVIQKIEIVAALDKPIFENEWHRVYRRWGYWS
jgi:hypothetical protein